MLLRITFSDTKKFLKGTIQSFKSYFAGGYQRLPKTPHCNPFSCTGSDGGATGIRPANHLKKTTVIIKETCNKKLKEPNLIINHHEVDTKKQENKKSKCEDREKDDDESSKCLVTRKLKELEMMDQSNVDLVLDIEEVLHYHSRLTCPVYRDIVEKFFVELYPGTFVLARAENSVSKNY
ncbi:hypothetical protein R6Q57_029243 [Mikania cordata]